MVRSRSALREPPARYGDTFWWFETATVLSRSLFQTKHFQTLFWTPDVRLVDCPGLVMPNFVPMETQVRIYYDKPRKFEGALNFVIGLERNPSHIKGFGNPSVYPSRVAAFAIGTGVWSRTSRAVHDDSRGQENVAKAQDPSRIQEGGAGLDGNGFTDRICGREELGDSQSWAS